MYNLRHLAELSTLPLPVSRKELCAYLNVSDSDAALWENEVLPLLRAAMSAAESQTKQALFQRTWELTTDDLGEGELPGWYVSGIIKIWVDGEEVDEDLYDLEGDYLFLDRAFPRGERYKVQFVRGFHPSALPDSIKMALKLRVSETFDNRAETPKEKKSLWDKLLDDFITPKA